MKTFMPFLIFTYSTVTLAFSSNDYQNHLFTHTKNAKGEICVLARELNFPGSSRSDSDIKKEKELCDLDSHTNAAVCPKLFSTNPAIEFFRIPNGKTKEQAERSCSQRAGQKTKMKKLAKYKLSTSCSRTASILSYYHIGKLLGINAVPPAVLRTMDLKYHNTLIDKGVARSKKPNPNELIAKIWRILKRDINRSPQNSRTKLLVDQNGQYSYGALSENPRGEERFNRPFYFGRNGNTGYDRFIARSTALADIKQRNSARNLVGTDLTSKNFTRLQHMKDASDMIVLDSILGQKDRIGNLHYRYVFLAEDNSGQLKKHSLRKVTKKIKKDPALSNQLTDRNKLELAQKYLQQSSRRVAVAKEMLMKDNDCGLRNENLFRQKRVLESIHHVSQETFVQLMRLNAEFKSGKLNEFLSLDLTLNKDELRQFRDGLNYVVSVLTKKCQQGRLHMDLDIKDHFNGVTVPSCKDFI